MAQRGVAHLHPGLHPHLPGRVGRPLAAHHHHPGRKGGRWLLQAEVFCAIKQSRLDGREQSRQEQVSNQIENETLLNIIEFR